MAADWISDVQPVTPEREVTMSIFETILSRVFGPEPADVLETEAAREATAAPREEVKPLSRAEVEAVIENIAEGQGHTYDWNESIVDLLELLGLDSSFEARRDLARELGYTGELDGSARMNSWLHEKVMDELARSGGRVPESLK